MHGAWLPGAIWALLPQRPKSCENPTSSGAGGAAAAGRVGTLYRPPGRARYRTRALKGTKGEGATPGRQERSRHDGRHLCGSAERRAASADRSRSIHGTCRDGARRSRAR